MTASGDRLPVRSTRASIAPSSASLAIQRARAHGRWLPTRWLLAALGVPMVFALAAFVWPVLGWVALGGDGLIVLLALVEWFRIPRHALEITRETPDVYAVGRPNPVSLRVKNRSNRSLVVELNDDLFPHADATGLPARFDLAPGARVVVRYSGRPTRRGAYALGDHFVRYGARGAFARRQERVAAFDEINVYPDVVAVRTYDQWARQDRADRLTGSLRMRGGESEFERLRLYARDDEFRHIDWKATARNRELMVRQYQTETQQSVLVVLDCARTMRGEAEGLSFLDHALNATLMLSHVALQRGDQVGLFTFDDQPRKFVAAASGRATERKIIQSIYALEPELTEADYTAAFTFLKSRARKRSLVVVFTQVLDASAAKRLSALMRGLLPRHLPLCVLLRDRDIDTLATAPMTHPRDAYVRAAAAEAIAWREQLVRDMKNAGVLVLDVHPDQMTPQVVRRYAEIKTRQLL